MSIVVTLLILGAALFLLLRLLLGSSGAQAQTSDAEQELLRMCLGNADQAKHFMEIERRNSPKISGAEAASRAMDSIRRDRR